MFHVAIFNLLKYCSETMTENGIYGGIEGGGTHSTAMLFR